MFLRTLALASTLTFLLAPLSAQAERVLLDTSKGMIELELDADRAPVTVANFIAYVESGFYDGLTFHRVIPGFMIQGGGLDANMQPRKTRDPVVNESDNGLSNTRGSLAMARTADPDSATSQFFINTADNLRLDGLPGRPGYTVFGHVIAGMEVVDRISAVETTTRYSYRDVPANPVVIHRAEVMPEPAAATEE